MANRTRVLWSMDAGGQFTLSCAAIILCNRFILRHGKRETKPEIFWLVADTFIFKVGQQPRKPRCWRAKCARSC